MRTGPAAPLLALAGLLAVAGAAAADGPGPRLAGDPPVDRALASLADDVDEAGCVRSYDACRPAATKWAALVAAHAGEAPRAWPAPNRSVGSWILDHADDLRDGPTRRCEDDASQEALCMARRVYSLSKSILAVEALGLDARALPLPDGGTRDLVAELNQNFTAGQYGSPSYVNDDVWALLALQAAAWDGPQARQAADFVASNQNADGGLGYTMGADSSADTTAAALSAMAPRNRTGFVGDALGYLSAAQVADGDGRACFALRPGRAANAASTAWALQGLVAAGENPLDWSRSGTTPTECLLRFQTESGAFANSLDDDQDRPTTGATMDALVGLAWTPFGAARGPVTPDVRNRTVRADAPVTLHAPDGFLVRGAHASADLTFTPREPGEQTLDGWTWTATPRPLEVRLRVRPPLPEPPSISAPEAHQAGTPVPVNLTPSDRWTRSLHLALPDGTSLEGPDHVLDLGPGSHRLTAVARNALGEAGEPASHKVLVRDPPPEVAVAEVTAGPSNATVTLRADATDPGGDDVALRWETPDGALLAEGPHLTVELDPGEARTVVAVAEDAGGATDRVQRVVQRPASTLSVAVDAPDETRPGPVELAARVDHDGPGSPSVTWFRGGERVGAGNATRLDLPPGHHAVRVVAKAGGVSAEAVHEVTVVEPGPADEAPQADREDGAGTREDGGDAPDPAGAARDGPERVTPLPSPPAAAAAIAAVLAIARRLRGPEPP